MASDEIPLLFNMDVLNRLRVLAPHSHWLEDLYQEFLKQTREQLTQLLEAVRQNNAQQVLFLLHAMKSSARQVGGELFAVQVEEWELLLSQDATLTQHSYYQAVNQAFTMLQTEIQNVFEQKEGRP